jgi:hypothetical protein
MKYHVTYRLMHPQSLPALSVAVMEASSHAELDAQVTKIKTKWQARGYRVQIMHVRNRNEQR